MSHNKQPNAAAGSDVDQEHGFPIVGIGASAGGLQALEELFRRMPTDTGLAFLVVTHLPRGRESYVPEIIGRMAAIPVSVAANGAAIKPNHIYFCPPDHVLIVRNRHIQLLPRESESQHKPIDVFLSSIAEDQGVASVGILLSGGGSDGALGMKAIKERGGFTLAQGHNGSGPQHSDMPDAAIAAGVVDLVLSVDQMSARLADYAAEQAAIERVADETEATQDYQAIYETLRDHVGHDFSGYKEKTFHRRVRRRMQVVQISDLHAYVEHLRSDRHEANLLFRDLLIGVTNFFRDQEAFESLEKVIPPLFDGKGASDSIRVWVPGCATGEEVYSIAILLREHMQTLRVSPKVQIFATDIDEAALAIARVGRYPAPLMENVSPERLKRFFVGDDASYAVIKDIRDMCVFSPHSVLRDPPFSRIDLISCRNLLIYMGSELQDQVVPVFHFALRPDGILFLGISENVSQHDDLFMPVDKEHRIFKRRNHALTRLQLRTMPPTVVRGVPNAAELRRDTAGAEVNLRRVIESRVLERFAPAHVVIDRDGEILHYSPRTGKYLEPASGLPNRQLLAMARKGLRLDLRAALREAVETRHRVERERIAVEIDDRVQMIDLLIEPLGPTDSDPLFLVLFKDVGLPVAGSETEHRQAGSADNDARVERLEQDLRDTRERLQSTIEEYETAVEELKSSNEELQSVNEELQSTNEELETSKEELQSLNEELHTVNSELNSKVDEVDRANTDLRNIFESTGIATVFLDKDLVIRTFTPAVSSVFNLISSDRGRPLTDIVSNLENGDLRGDVQTVFDRGEAIERKVRRKDGKAHYLMRILPYLGHDDVIEGVLVTFVDVTRLGESPSA